MLHSSDPLPSSVEERMGRGGRRGVPKDPLEKIMAVGWGQRMGMESEKARSRRRRAMVGVLSHASSCALWWRPGKCSSYKIAAANFHWFPSNTFSCEIASIWRKITGEHVATPTAPRLSTPTPYWKETLMNWRCATIFECVVKWLTLPV